MVPFRELLGRTGFYGEADGGAVFGIFYFAWVIPYMAIVWVLGLYFLRFFLYLAATVRFRFLMAATFYLGGAIGLELVGGRCAELHGFDNWTYITITTAEETPLK